MREGLGAAGLRPERTGTPPSMVLVAAGFEVVALEVEAAVGVPDGCDGDGGGGGGAAGSLVGCRRCRGRVSSNGARMVGRRFRGQKTWSSLRTMMSVFAWRIGDG